MALGAGSFIRVWYGVKLHQIDSSEGEVRMAERKRLYATMSGINDALNKEVSAYMRAIPGTPAADPDYRLAKLGQRSWRLRQIRDYYDMMLTDLGGPNVVSFAQSETARRLAVLSVVANEMETDFVTNAETNFNVEEYIIVSRAQNQLFKTIGMGRKQRLIPVEGKDGAGVTDLHDYLGKKDTA